MRKTRGRFVLFAAFSAVLLPGVAAPSAFSADLLPAETPVTEPAAPIEIQPVVSAGTEHSCALQTDGTMSCWGSNASFESVPASGSFVSLGAGDHATCAVRVDLTLQCWGSGYGDSLVTPAGTFTSVSMGTRFSCAVRTTGVVLCWGEHTDWSVGTADEGYTSISVGPDSWHGCGLRADDTVGCWEASLGASRRLVPPAGTFLSVSVGNRFACGVRTNATMVCWADVSWAQVDAPSGLFVSVTAGATHACGLRLSGEVTCWGTGSAGVLRPPSGTFLNIDSGDDHVCGMRTDGAAVCWGADNAAGELTPPAVVASVSVGYEHTCILRTNGTIRCFGLSTTGATAAPGGVFRSVSAGSSHTCGIRLSGAAVCWGNNYSGQARPPSGSFASVSAGTQQTCALRTNGTVACWGYDENGASSPPAGTFVSVSAGGYYACGVRQDHALVCWGDQTNILGTVWGVPPPPGGTFTEVSSGYFHACALRTDETIACWGENQWGQSDPPSGTFTSVAAGVDQSCGVRTSGAVVCWGYPSSGAAPPGGVFTSVTAGSLRGCALRNDSVFQCWGVNAQLGEPMRAPIGSAGWGPLRIKKAGSGSGTVASNPEGITCGAVCRAWFGPSGSVTLTAHAAPGSHFVGWSGGGCSGTDDCTVAADPARVLTARFAKDPSATAGNTRVTLAWPGDAWAAIAKPTGFVVEQNTDGEVWTRVRSLGGAARSLTVSGLTNWTEYRFRMAATGGGLQSEWFELAPVVPQARASAVRNLRVVPRDGRLLLDWDAPLNDGGAPITDYVVQFTRTGKAWITFADGVSTATEATVTDVVNFRWYSLRVLAVNAAGPGKASPVVKKMPRRLPPGRPTHLAVVADDGRIEVTWAAPADDGGTVVTDYRIQYSTNGRTWTTVPDGTSVATSASITGLVSGSTYWVRIAAINAAGTGGNVSLRING